jgi:hypothetical protein
MKRSITAVVAASMAVIAAAQPPAPYAGQETRDIKALSKQDVESRLNGQGASMAKAAELNGYPGPAHVLELAKELALSADQREATETLMQSHKARASKLGADVVEAERALDRLFAAHRADASSVQGAAARVGELRAALQAEHLTTHIVQTRILSADQVRRYQVLRGYAASPAGAASGGGHSYRH